MEQLYIGAQSYSARLVLLLARFSRSQQLFFRKRLKILAFSFIQQDKSSSHMQSKTAYFLYI